MRYVAKGCAAFAIGLFLTALCGYKYFYIPAVVFLVLGLLALVFARYIPVRRLWLGLLIATVGSCCFGLHTIFVYNPAIAYAGTTQEVHGTLKEKTEYDNNSTGYIISVSKVGDEDFLIPFNMRFSSKDQVDVNYGDEITFEAELVRATEENETYIFDSDMSRTNYLQGKPTTDITVIPRFSVTSIFLNFRDSLMNSVQASIGEPQNAAINGILFGKSNGIPYTLRDAVNRCGLAHIFAVSGLHVAILSSALMYLLKGLKCPGKISSIILIGVLFCFVAMAGFTPSAMRACLMASISAFALLFDKRVNGLKTISIAAAIILFASPPIALGLSFILSFSACLGILLFADKIFVWIRDKLKWYKSYQLVIIEIFSVSLAAMFAASPTLLLAFGMISIVSPFVNILVIPFVPLIFVSGILTALFGLFSVDIANVIGYFCEGLCGAIFACVEFIAKFPFCNLPANYSFVPLVLICCAVFITIAILYKKNLIRVKVAALFCAIIIVIPTINNIVMNKDTCTVTVIGSGYGSSVVITADEQTVVINCGGGNNSGKSVCQFLDSRGIKKVDALIFTEMNNKHMQGSNAILEVMPVSCMIIPEDAEYTEMHQLAMDHGTNVVWAKDAHIELYPIIIDISTKTKSLAMSVVVGGLCFGFSNNISALMAIGNQRYINVALIDGEFSGWHGDFETGFNIILSDQDYVPENSCVTGLDFATEFVISGGMLKVGWL